MIKNKAILGKIKNTVLYKDVGNGWSKCKCVHQIHVNCNSTCQFFGKPKKLTSGEYVLPLCLKDVTFHHLDY